MKDNDNLEKENIETLDEETQKDNSQEQDDAPDPKEKRHAEQLAGSKKEAEKWQNLAVDLAFGKASENIDTLKDLYEKDPKLAQKVAGMFDWEGSDWGSFDNFLGKSQSKKTLPTKSLTQEEIDRMLDEREKERENTKANEKLEKLVSGLDDDEQELVKNYIKKYKPSALTREEATELFEMATLYIKKDKLKEEKKEDAKLKLASIGSTSSKKPSKDEFVTIIRNGKLVQIPNE